MGGGLDLINFSVGQFHKFAAAEGRQGKICWVTEETSIMTKFKHSLLCGVTAFAAVGAVAATTMTAAQAGGFALREQSAIGQGSSFAGVAAGGGNLSSMYWNPATLTQTSGTNTESVFLGRGSAYGY